MITSISPALAERAEGEAYYDFEAAAPAAAQAALGTRLLRIGGGVALAMPRDSSRFWSKVVGLGFDEPVTAGLLRRVIEFYREQDMSAATIQLAPSVLPEDWDDICAELNICASQSVMVKLAGRIDEVAGRSQDTARLDTRLRVGRVTAERAQDWAAVMWECFGFPVEHQLQMAIGSVGRPGWQSFAVFEGDTIVATAGLHLFEGTGHLFGGATLPGARRRGAQSALIAARAHAARLAGCEWIIGETGAEGPGQRSASLHNMLRAGLTARYDRQSWTWRESS
jgi:hypothetical protein